MAYETGTITGTFTYPGPDDEPIPHRGTVRISMNVPRIYDGDGSPIMSGTRVVALDADGAFSVEWPASDDLTLVPSGARATVSVRLPGASSQKFVDIVVPGGGTVDVTDEPLLDPEAPSYSGGIDAATAANINDTDSLTRTALDALYEGGGGSSDWDDITNKPTTFPPTVPIAQADVTDLDDALAAKADASALDDEVAARGSADTALASAIVTAQSEAISTAATDATTKANAAQSAATSAAATDATTKANNAQSAAESTAATGLNAHLTDTTDAHDASAISFVPGSGVAATDVQAAILEVAADLSTNGEVHSAVLTNGTDQTTVLQAECDALMAAGGGTLLLPEGTVTIDGTLTLVNDGATPPKQAVLMLKGQGGHWSGRGTAPVGGTFLDIKGTDTYGKIKTNGLGLFGATGITFKDSAGTTTPFIYTTNTTLHLDQNSFVGSKNAATCDQDAIILGGINQVEGGAGWTDGFQGYGSVLTRNFFSGIRRGFVLQAFANAIQINENTAWYTCGNTTGAFIDINGKPGTGGQSIAGGTIGRNLIEMVNYAYGIIVDNAVGMNFDKNDFYDQSSPTVANIWLKPAATNCRITTGYTGSSKPNLIDEGWTNIVDEVNANGERTHNHRDQFFTGNVVFNAVSGVGGRVSGPAGDNGFIQVETGNNPYPRVILSTAPATVVADGVTTNGSNVVTSATAAWAATDVGHQISGTGIQSNTVIVRRVSATTIWISKNATATGTGISLSFGRVGSTRQEVRFERAHTVALGTAPTIAVAAGAGSGATTSLAGADTAGTITLTTGTGTAAGTQVNITLNIAYTGTQHIVISPANAAAADAHVYAERVSSTLWRIVTGAAALTASTAYKWSYSVIQAA